MKYWPGETMSGFGLSPLRTQSARTGVRVTRQVADGHVFPGPSGLLAALHAERQDPGFVEREHVVPIVATHRHRIE